MIKPETARMITPIGIETPNAILAGSDKPGEDFKASVLRGVGAELLVDDEVDDDCESDEVIEIMTVSAMGEY